MTTAPVTPVQASSVILAREDDGQGWQCYMVRRHVRSDFAADVYVFPGGKVDPQDVAESVRAVVDGQPPADASADDWYGSRMAAIRELFEESGVLLARRDDGKEFVPDSAERARLEEYREAVHEGRETMEAVARALSLRFDPGRLTAFSRWITPEPLPRRFDTYFFVARLPEGQEPLHDAVETTDGQWITPSSALELHAAGEFPLVFATVEHLRRMARFGTVDALVKGVTPADLEPVMPKMIERDGRTQFLLPGDEGY